MMVKENRKTRGAPPIRDSRKAYSAAKPMRPSERVLEDAGTLTLPGILPEPSRFLDPKAGSGAARDGALLRDEEEPLDASVSEIHRHPLRPSGFQEPLFLGQEAKKEIAEHLRESSGWLGKASEAERPLGEPCHVLRRPGGTAYVVRPGPSRRARRTGFVKRRVARVLERWREVRGWWDPGETGRCVDRLVFRLLLSGGAVAVVALERTTGEWLWVGTSD